MNSISATNTASQLLKKSSKLPLKEQSAQININDTMAKSQDSKELKRSDFTKMSSTEYRKSFGFAAKLIGTPIAGAFAGYKIFGTESIGVRNGEIAVITPGTCAKVCGSVMGGVVGLATGILWAVFSDPFYN